MGVLWVKKDFGKKQEVLRYFMGEFPYDGLLFTLMKLNIFTYIKIWYVLLDWQLLFSKSKYGPKI